MPVAAKNVEPPPKRVNRMRYPREFLLEDGGRISWVTTESFESIKGREVTRTGDDGVQFEKKIVAETTTKETLDKIAETADAETITEPLKAQTNAGSPDGGSDGDGEDDDADDCDEEDGGEEEEDDDDDDDLAPCEGTFAICCAADLSPEFMNHFIQQNMSGNLFHMVFVDSLSAYYETETESPVQNPSSTSSPFKGKSPHECYLLLRQLVRETDSRIDWQEFVIVDEQTLKDETVVLVAMPLDDDEEAIWVRATMHLASQALFCSRSGSIGLDEMIEEVHEEQGIGGVLRSLG